jgi:predicted nuclease of predicted toxin-antitoxin system
MKLIIDAHLPESICKIFHNCNCIHTKQFKKGNQTKDSYINELSIKEQRAVITKDNDFYYSYIANRKPYKLVLVKLGNMRLAELKNYFKSNNNKIIKLLKNHSFIILEKYKIRIID